MIKYKIIILFFWSNLYQVLFICILKLIIFISYLKFFNMKVIFVAIKYESQNFVIVLDFSYSMDHIFIKFRDKKLLNLKWLKIYCYHINYCINYTKVVNSFHWIDVALKLFTFFDYWNDYVIYACNLSCWTFNMLM